MILTPAIILELLVKFGPVVLPQVLQIAHWIRDGKKDVTAEDLQYLIDFGKKSSADYLAQAGGPPQQPPAAP